MPTESVSDETGSSVYSPHRQVHRFGRIIIGIGVLILVFLAGYFCPRIDLSGNPGSQEQIPAILKVAFPDEPVFSPVPYQDRVEQNRRNLRSHLLLVTSPSVLAKALADRRIAMLSCLRRLNDPEAWLRGCITVENPQDSQLLIVTMTDGPLADRPTIINAVVDSYLDVSKTWVDELHTERIRYLKNLDRDLQAQLTILRKRRRDAIERKDDESLLEINEQLAIDNEMFRRLTISRSELEYNAQQGAHLSLISQAKPNRPKLQSSE